MKHEKSCGAVIYNFFDGELYILLLEHNKGHWSFSKGHVEKGESEKEAALREIKEETNLEVEIDLNFREVSVYSPKKNVMKEVIFFLATPKMGNISPQLSEINEIKWYKYDDALNVITYDNDRKILKLAYSYIKKYYN